MVTKENVAAEDDACNFLRQPVKVGPDRGGNRAPVFVPVAVI